MTDTKTDSAIPAGTTPDGMALRPDITEKPAVVLPFWTGPVAIVANCIAVIVAVLLAINAFLAFGSDKAGEGVGSLVGIAVASLFIWTTVSMINIIQPGNARVYQFFGDYVGTVRRTGLVLTLPFISGSEFSVKDQNFETPVSKVNDLNGNPINISGIVVWRLADTAKASFAVEDYVQYLATQAEAAVRHVAAKYPYDAGTALTSENTPAGVTPTAATTPKYSLLGSADVINQELFDEITDRAKAAGVEIIEVRINNLSYSVEIAQAMLQRQQATAIIDARKIIVEGAVGIVEDAVKSLESKTKFTEADKAGLASNLLVVLVGEGKVTPTVSVGGKNK